jgi:hypothetical protein
MAVQLIEKLSAFYEVEDSLPYHQELASGSHADEQKTSPYYHRKLEFVNNRLTYALNEHHDLHLIECYGIKRNKRYRYM